MIDPPPLRASMLTMDFPPTRGGIQTMCREILARARRVQWHVVAPGDPGAEAIDRSIGVPVRRVRSVAPGRRGYAPTLAWAARDEIGRRRPHIVLAMHPLAAPGAFLPPRAPVAVFCHGTEFRSSRIRAVARAVLPRAARVVANSAFTRSLAVALGAPAERTDVVPVGAPEPTPVADERIRAVRARIGGGRLALSVARLADHKGVDTLIDATPSLAEDVRVVVVGDGPARAALEERARARAVADRVVFAGSVSDDDLAAYYAAADAFVLLSRETPAGFEGGGIALLEACARGLPVVATASGGIPETIRDGETGLLVPPDDPHAAAAALARVLGDAALAQRLGDSAHSLATGERSWRRFVERLEDGLEGAVRA